MICLLSSLIPCLMRQGIKLINISKAFCVERIMNNLLAEFIKALESGEKPKPQLLEVSELEMFLDALFGIKRMLVIKVDAENKESTVAAMKKFAEKHGIEFEEIDAKTLTVDKLRGEVEFITVNGERYFQRKKPFYWPVKRKMIVVRGLTKQCDKDIFRAFIDIGCLAGYSHNNLPPSKLPEDSGFVFLAEDDFPNDEFTAMSGYWHEENRLFDVAKNSVSNWNVRSD